MLDAFVNLFVSKADTPESAIKSRLDLVDRSSIKGTPGKKDNYGIRHTYPGINQSKTPLKSSITHELARSKAHLFSKGSIEPYISSSSLHSAPASRGLESAHTSSIFQTPSNKMPEKLSTFSTQTFESPRQVISPQVYLNLCGSDTSPLKIRDALRDIDLNTNKSMNPTKPNSEEHSIHSISTINTLPSPLHLPQKDLNLTKLEASQDNGILKSQEQSLSHATTAVTSDAHLEYDDFSVSKPKKNEVELLEGCHKTIKDNSAEGSQDRVTICDHNRTTEKIIGKPSTEVNLNDQDDNDLSISNATSSDRGKIEGEVQTDMTCLGKDSGYQNVINYNTHSKKGNGTLGCDLKITRVKGSQSSTCTDNKNESRMIYESNGDFVRESELNSNMRSNSDDITHLTKEELPPNDSETKVNKDQQKYNLQVISENTAPAIARNAEGDKADIKFLNRDPECTSISIKPPRVHKKTVKEDNYREECQEATSKSSNLKVMHEKPNLDSKKPLTSKETDSTFKSLGIRQGADGSKTGDTEDNTEPKNGAKGDSDTEEATLKIANIEHDSFRNFRCTQKFGEDDNFNYEIKTQCNSLVKGVSMNHNGISQEAIHSASEEKLDLTVPTYDIIPTKIDDRDIKADYSSKTNSTKITSVLAQLNNNLEGETYRINPDIFAQMSDDSNRQSERYIKSIATYENHMDSDLPELKEKFESLTTDKMETELIKLYEEFDAYVKDLKCTYEGVIEKEKLDRKYLLKVYQDIQLQKSNLESLTEEKSSQIRDLERKVDQKTQEIDKLTSRIEILKEKTTDIHSEKTKIESELITSNAEIAKKIEEIQYYKNFKIFDRPIGNLITEFKSSRSSSFVSYLENKEQITGFKSKDEDSKIKQTIKDQKERIDSLVKNLRLKEEILNEKEQVVKDKEQLIMEKEHQINEKDNVIRLRDDLIEKLHSQYTDICQSLKISEQENIKATQKLHDEIETIKMENIQKQERIVEDHLEKLESSKADFNKVKDELNDVKVKSTRINQRLRYATTQLEKYSIDNQHLLSEKNEILKRLTKLEGNTADIVLFPELQKLYPHLTLEMYDSLNLKMVENWSFVQLTNLIKMITITLQLPFDKLITRLPILAISVQLERSIYMKFFERVYFQLFNEEVDGQKLTMGAYEQYKKTNSLSLIDHPLSRLIEETYDYIVINL